VILLVDREEGGREAVEKFVTSIENVFKMSEFIIR